MAGCHDMMMDQIYYCGDCGLELKVVGECRECQDDCGCEDNCEIMCCGKPLTLKE